MTTKKHVIVSNEVFDSIAKQLGFTSVGDTIFLGSDVAFRRAPESDNDLRMRLHHYMASYYERGLSSYGKHLYCAVSDAISEASGEVLDAFASMFNLGRRGVAK